MGKTYKNQSNIDDLNVVYGDDSITDADFDSDMEEFLNRQIAASASRRPKGERKHQRDPEIDLRKYHRLPGDWQDFDYTSGSQHLDDWR